jgi:hypothetical protein
MTGPTSARASLTQVAVTQPVWVLAAAAATLLCVWQSTTSIFDPDAYWHVLMGRDIWAEHRLSGDPAWTFGPHESWQTTQWLSELVMAGAHAAWGWTGLTVLKVLAALCTLAVLAGATLRGHSRRARLLIFTLAVLALAGEIQERPASFVLPLTAVAAWQAATWIRNGHLPRVWHVAALTVVWANLHGSWLLVPALWALLAVLNVINGKRFDRRVVARAVAATFAGLITPVGWAGLGSAVRIRNASAASISEWQPSSTLAFSFAVLLMMLAVTLTAAALGQARPRVTELGWLLAWGAVAVLAFRNIAPAVVLLAPVAADVLARAWPDRGAPPPPPSPARARRVGAVAAALLATGLPVAAIAGTAHQGGVPADAPTALIARIAHEPGPRRVITEYEMFGQVLALSRPGVSTPLDGRTDRYGAERVARHTDLVNARPGWRDQIEPMAATDALLYRDTALTDALTYAGWRQAGADARFVWLQPPSR